MKMKGYFVKCKNCGHVGEAIFPPPKGSPLGDEFQAVPACAECGSADVRITTCFTRKQEK